jgi:FYVE, RhoGEF and PH domain containing 5/6
MCQLCTSEFTITFRRHHCRCCGKVVCGACSANKAPLPYLKNRSVRVCDECYEKLFKQLQQLENYVLEHATSSGEIEKTSESDDAINTWKQTFFRSHPRSSKGKGKKRYMPSVLKEVFQSHKYHY